MTRWPEISCVWKVAARYGIPAEMATVICQIPQRNADLGVHGRRRVLDRFEVTQGLRRGCVMSPTMFDVFGVESIEIIAVRVSKDDVILQKNLGDLEEETGSGLGTTLNRVRRAVWATLHADDAGVVSRSVE